MAVTTSTPGTVARTPEEYEHKLEAFASGQEAVHGQKTSSRCINSPDPTADLDGLILKSIEAVGADLVVMATHLPRHLDAVMPSHGDRIASHTDVSVFLVRPA